MPSGTIAEHVESIERDGYVILTDVYDQSTVAGWRELDSRLQGEVLDGAATRKTASMCELAPDEMLPHAANPMILDILESLMGPFVQLDSLTLEAAAPVDPAEITSPIPPGDGWHRDHWAQVPFHAYIRPLGVNAICYLQDLNEQTGPLRVIPGSHRTPTTLSAEQRFASHPDEELLAPRAGDVALFHNCLLHAGSRNLSSANRSFVRAYYNQTWMIHRDDHSGPNVARIIKRASQAGDHRTLRLFGRDERLLERMQCGFTDPDEPRWEAWRRAEGSLTS